jgi:hypothetical protein
MPAERRFPLTITGVVLSQILVVAAATMLLCGGRFVYALDDPYITLALGWHIGHGHYGINTVEAASPSSSILYPFLLGAFAWTPLQEWVPLLINSAAAAGTAALFAAMCVRYSIGSRTEERLRTVFLISVVCFATNIVGLVFTGLEHSLHTLTSVAVLYGLARTLEDGEVPRWLLPVVILNPLLRFEGAALTCLTLLALAISGHARAAVIGFALSALAVGAYMLSMASLGLPLLPSSVLLKTAVLAPNDVGLMHLLQHAIDGVWEYGKPGIPLWLLLALVLLHPVLRARGLLRPDAHRHLRWERELILVAVVAGSVVAHALFGGWGWWFRYETYAVAVTLTAVIVLWHTQIESFVHRASTGMVGLAGLAILALNAYYVRGTLMTPLAGRGIYEQQFQMHRFAVEFYRRPVAVNDLGWVSYQNPQYVLDLWGLGSEAARKARLLTHPPGWLGDLTRAHDVGVAMIYSSLFCDDIPANWRPVAQLRGAHRHVTAAFDVVTFYATSRAAEDDALEALHRFASQIPPSVAQVTFNSVSQCAAGLPNGSGIVPPTFRAATATPAVGADIGPVAPGALCP